MSAIFGEMLTFPQEKGPSVKLRTFGDEFYARYETEDGYSAVYDKGYGLYCYALLEDGAFVSSGIPLGQGPPSSLKKHLYESNAVRQSKAEKSARRKGLA